MKELLDILNNINSSEEKEEFLNEILTKSEIETLTKRWRILKMLNDGITQREITKNLKVSLCNVTRGAKILKNKNAIVKKYLRRTNND